MLIHSLTLLIGLIALFFSAYKFVSGAASIARILNLSPLFIGLTVVGLGSSLPEMLLAGFASFAGNAELAIGNAIGANIANLGLVLGITALVKPLACQSRLIKQESLVLLIVSLVSYFVTFDGLGKGDSLLLLMILVCFLVWLIRSAKKQEYDGTFEKELKTALPNTLTVKKAWIYLSAGLVGLLISAKLSVWAAVNVAHLLGVSEFIIGLTVMAISSSLPELATSIASVLKKEDDLALGNIISSSLYNLLIVYAVSGLIASGTVAEGLLSRDFPVLIGLTAGVFFLIAGIAFKTTVINRWIAALFLSGYFSYLWFIYQSLTEL